MAGNNPFHDFTGSLRVGLDPTLAAPPPQQSLYPQLDPEDQASLLARLGQKTLSGLGYIGGVLDKTFGGRALRGLLGGKPQELLSLIPGSDDVWHLTDPNNIVHGRDLLQQWGVVGRPQPGFDIDDILGMATEAALDPSMYLMPFANTATGALAAKMGALPARLADRMRGFNYLEGQVNKLAPVKAGLAQAPEMVPRGAAIAPRELELAAAREGLPLEPQFRRVIEERANVPVGFQLNSQAPSTPTPLPPGVPPLTLEEAQARLAQGYLPPQGKYLGDINREGWTALDVAGPSNAKGPYALKQQEIGLGDATSRRLKNPETGALESVPLQGTALSGLLGIGLPFSEPSMVLGTGATAQKIAEYLGRANDWIKGTAPVRYARALFDPRVDRTTTAPVQEIASQIRRPLEREGMSELYGQVFDLRRELESVLPRNPEEVNRLILRATEGSPIPQTAAMLQQTNPQQYVAMQQAGQLGQLRPLDAYRKELLERNPRLYQELQQSGRLEDLEKQWAKIQEAGQQIGVNNKGYLEAEHAAGIPTPQLADTTDYSRRLLNPLEDTHQSLWGRIKGKAKQALGGSHTSQISREELYRYFPEGTTQINDLARAVDQAGQPLLVGPHRALSDLEVEAALRKQLTKTPGQAGSGFEDLKDLPKWAQAQGLTKPEDIAAAVERVRTQARDLGQHWKGLSERFATENRPFFLENPIYSMAVRGAQSVKSTSNARALYQGLPDVAKEASQLGQDAVRVPEVLKLAGLTHTTPQGVNIAEELAAKSLGVKPQELANLAIPREVAADMTKWLKAYTSPDELKPVLAAFDAATNLTKGWLTVPFPGFHTRNIVTGLFNMWRDGALSWQAMKEAKDLMQGRPIEALPGMAKNTSPQKVTDGALREIYQQRVAFGHSTHHTSDMLLTPAAQLEKDVGGVPGRLLRDPEQVGQKLIGVAVPKTSLGKGEGVPVAKVLSDLGMGTRAQLADFETRLGQPLKDLAVPKGRVGELSQTTTGEAVQNWGKGWTKETNWNPLDTDNTLMAQSRKVGESSEDWMRTAHYLAKRRQGFSPEEAAAAVRKYHFDYSDVTPFERNVMKRIIPFYTFSSRNLPPLLQDLITRPAKLTSTIRAATMASGDRGQFVPPYIAEGSNIALPGAPEGYNRYLTSFGLPFEDEMFGALGSLASGNVKRTLGGLMGGMNPFFKYPIEEATGTQLHSGRKLADMRPDVLANALTMGDEEYGRPLSQFLSNTPASRVISTVSKLLDERKGPAQTAFNVLSGVKVSDVDMQKQTEIAAREALKEMLAPKEGVKLYSDIYVKPEDLSKLSPEEFAFLNLYRSLELKAQQAAKQAKQEAGGRPGVRVSR